MDFIDNRDLTRESKDYKKSLEHVDQKNNAEFINKSFDSFRDVFKQLSPEESEPLTNLIENFQEFVVFKKKDIQDYLLNKNESWNAFSLLFYMFHYLPSDIIKEFKFDESLLDLAFCSMQIPLTHSSSFKKEDDFKKLEWFISHTSNFSLDTNSSAKLNNFINLGIMKENSNSIFHQDFSVSKDSIWNCFSAQQIFEKNLLEVFINNPYPFNKCIEGLLLPSLQSQINDWIKNPCEFKDSDFGKRLLVLSNSEGLNIGLDDAFKLYEKLDNVYEKALWAGWMLDVNWHNKKGSVASEKEFNLFFEKLLNNLSPEDNVIDFILASKKVWLTGFKNSYQKNSVITNSVIKEQDKMFNERRLLSSLKPTLSPQSPSRF